MDCKLFDRTTTGSELTADGRAMLEAAERIESEFEQLRSSRTSLTSQVSGTVRIGAPDGFGVAYLSAKIHLLTHRHPDLRIELVPVPHSFSLSQREADIAILVGRPEKGRLRGKKLVDFSLGLYASHSYLTEHGTPATLADLRHHTLVGYVEDLLYSRALNYSTELWNGWESTLQISSSLGQVQAISTGAGIGVLHDFMATDVPDLVPVLPAHKIKRSYWCAWHESLKDSKRISVVVSFLDELIREDSGLFFH